MKFADVEQALDRLSDREQVPFLERIVPQLRGKDIRSALVVLANLYMLQKKFKKAVELYEQLGFHEDSVKARARI